MTRQVFDRDLTNLQNKLLSLGSAVEEDLEKSVNALFTGNIAVSQRLIDFDKWVNEQRIEIVMSCLTLIATQQPAGPDMRRLAATIEIAGELERIHDYVKGIGKIAIMLSEGVIPTEMSKLTHYLPQMAAITRQMLHDALDAFTNHDAAAARAIPLRDQDVDEFYKKLRTLEKFSMTKWLVCGMNRGMKTYKNISNPYWKNFMTSVLLAR